MGKDNLEKKLKPEVIKVSKKPLEKYIAFPSFNSKKIIVYGKDPSKVYEDARKKGYQKPVLMFMPDPNITHIYNAA